MTAPVIQPNPESKCRDCFFFADGQCRRFRLVSDLHYESKDADVIIADCGGYESVNPAEDPTP